MPPCHCDYAKCAGATVSKQTFAHHQQHDRTKGVQEALLASEQACKEIDVAISVHLSGLSNCNPPQADKVFPPHVRPVETSRPQHTEPSYRQQVELLLRRLASIESVIEEITLSAEFQLANTCRPILPEDEFPLTPLLNKALCAKNDLACIHGRSPAIAEVKKALSARVSDLLLKLDGAKKRWREQKKSFSFADEIDRRTLNTDLYNSGILVGADPIIQVSIFTMVVLQVLLHTSRRGCHFLLSMLQYIVQLSLMRNNSVISIHDQKLLADFPKDPDSAMRHLNLDSKDTIYAVCPKAKCQKLHAPNFGDGSPIPRYPKYCNHSGLDGKHCGTRLTRPRCFGQHEVEVPVKRFVAFSFKGFLASLTSRPGLEEKMDAAWSHAFDAATPVGDVFGGEFLRNFKGSDGRLFGFSGPEGRYVFSLSVDFFNPFSNKQAGKKVSLGVVSVVCLNLPIAIRYLPENMFLAGIIPGPKEPRLTIINHYLAPLVTEFLDFWNPGVRFSKTYQFPEGRLLLCALVLVVCDLVATRKVVASGLHNHEHFCNLCHCTRSEHGYRDTNYQDWEHRTHADWVQSAEEWLACETESERDAKFSATGLRWSELLRLPYFDMVRCVVVDPMHNLFLGLLKEHFTGLLGVDLPKEKQNTVVGIELGPLPSNMNQKDKDGVERLKGWLALPFISTFSPIQEKAVGKLMRVNLPALEFICKELRVPLPPLTSHEHPNRTKHSKKDYANSLLAWRRAQPESDETGAETGTRHGHVFHSEDLAGIWSDIEQITTPTWMTSIPSNLGSASHGKLKADQWRTAGTVHLPLSLIRLWSIQVNDQPRSLRCRQILDVTMSLVCAVIIATSHSITTENAEAYLKYMTDYLNGIKRLFPEYRFRPNHHMSLHIYDFLLSFGPVHSWWAFPFERMIGMIQRMPNNGKIGELEETMARSYTRSANLRTLPLRAGCPEVIQHSKFIFQHLIAPQSRSSLNPEIPIPSGHLEDAFQAQEIERSPGSVLSPELRSAFNRAGIDVTRRARTLSHLSINGVTFTTSSKHAGNACALVAFPYYQQSLLPCQIAYIVELGGADKEIFLGVRRHKPAHIGRDPYLRYAALRAKIWDTEMDGLEVVRPVDVASHFAGLPIYMDDKDLIVVTSLSRTIVID